ncbi:MAG: ATP-binding protein [Bacteroidales bacterium]|nr:ATP-binding protein [Bacteroidales bacterium]
MLITRLLSDIITEKLRTTNKAVILYGARQLGKTTLSKFILSNLGFKTLSINADQEKYIDILSSRDLNKLKSLVHGYELLFIDEAQRVPDIGINLKILTDELPELKILVTGSSSLNLADKVSEPLTGRKWTFTLFPLSLQELSYDKNRFELNDKLEELLVYGSYPEVYTTINKSDKTDLLYEISSSYLYKDILELSNIKYPRKIRDLVRLLAFQIGSEVSMNELSRTLGISRDTVENYIDLLEKSYIIFRISGYSKNMRKEIRKQDKFYFYDLGIRNAVIDNLKFPGQRNDIGALWENFIIAERKKYLHYNRIRASSYFWRTYTGAELDYIEEENGALKAVEIKYNKEKVKVPKSWIETYPDSGFQLINKDNYLDFVL